MKKVLIVVIAGLALGGCQTIAERQRAEFDTQLDRAGYLCNVAGLVRGTSQYADCIQRAAFQQQQDDQAMRTAAISAWAVMQSGARR